MLSLSFRSPSSKQQQQQKKKKMIFHLNGKYYKAVFPTFSFKKHEAIHTAPGNVKWKYVENIERKRYFFSFCEKGHFHNKV